MNKDVVTQIVLGILRHALSAGGLFGVAVGDDLLIQIASAVVGVGALIWSAKRKVDRAPQ